MGEAAFYRRYARRLPLSAVDPRIATSHEWRYAYARIPKAANSTTLHTVETFRYPTGSPPRGRP